MNTGNRVLWTLIGVVLTGLGALGVLAATRRLTGIDTESPLLGEDLLVAWRRWEGWATTVLVVAGLLVALAGWWLLARQLRSHGRRPLPDLRVGTHAPAASRAKLPGGTALRSAVPAARVEGAFGVTSVHYRAMTGGLARDLDRQPAVRSAHVLITGHHTAPEMLLDLTVAAGADLTVVRGHVEAAIRRFTATTGLTPSSVEVTTRLATETPSRAE